MALGGNLKKKKLIPDKSDDRSKKESTSKKKAPSKKAPVKTDKKISPSTKVAKTVSNTKKTSPKTKSEGSKRKSHKQSKKPNNQKTLSREGKVAEKKVQKTEEVIETPNLIPSIHQEQRQASAGTGHDQIISAYSVYIAQELYERKTALRKQYVQEIANLQGIPVQFILLTIGTERYALDIDCVKEVVPIPTVSKTPNTPSHIQGVVNVRGNNYVVFDLAKKFQVIAQEVPRYLLVLSNKRLKSSIPLSSLPTTFKTNGSQISHSLQTIENAQLDASYIKGMIQDNEDLIYYLDIVELLKNDKAIVIPEKLVRESEW